ncbi:MAG: CDP-diacylglycerol--serine O-phosphatidyltransferase [Puniceicoccaceae bacterium]
MNKADSKIYLLPNLMTAGNLFCGFAAVLSILEGALQQKTGFPATGFYHRAILFILGAFLFDILDGRVARLGGSESAFGREFDSLADLISFGVAPALLVFQIVLAEFARAGWLIAFVYLVCGALRLARFNCVAARSTEGAAHDFQGFPIPAAAGLTASLTLMMLWFEEGQVHIGAWKYALPPLLLFLSFLMFSRVQYPSFKTVHWRMENSLTRFIAILVVLLFTALNWQWMPAVLFTTYLGYGLLFGRRARPAAEAQGPPAAGGKTKEDESGGR